MNPENNLENAGTKEAAPAANIERSDTEVAKEIKAAIDADIASLPDSKKTIDSIELSLSLTNPSQGVEIRNEMGLDTRLQDLDHEVILLKTEANSEIEALTEDVSDTISPDNIIEDSKKQKLANEVEPEKNGIYFVFEQNPELEKIGTKEEYRHYIEQVFPESKVKDILYHYSNHDKIKEEGFKFFTEIGVPTGAGEIEAIWFTKKDGNYWGGNNLNKYAAVINTIKPLDARNSLSEDDEPVREYKRIWEIGTEKDYDYFDKTKKWELQKNRKLAFKEDGYDSILAPNLDEVAIFDKENIHVLGSKVDIEKFKGFVENWKKTSDSYTSD